MTNNLFIHNKTLKSESRFWNVTHVGLEIVQWCRREKKEQRRIALLSTYFIYTRQLNNRPSNQPTIHTLQKEWMSVIIHIKRYETINCWFTIMKYKLWHRLLSDIKSKRNQSLFHDCSRTPRICSSNHIRTRESGKTVKRTWKVHNKCIKSVNARGTHKAPKKLHFHWMINDGR